LSHLRAIEDMTPGLLGAPVYAKGYIRSYARFLGLDEQTTLDRYLSECAAILKDPEKPEIAPPATSKARKLPVAVPVLGILIVALIGGGAMLFLANGDKGAVVTPETAQADDPAATVVPAAAPQLRIVALKSGHLTVRSAKGDKYVDRAYHAGESFILRVGAGHTVTVDDGSAFEWRLGDQSLGLLAETGPVFAQSVDQAALRQPIVVEPVATEPVLTPNGDPMAPAATTTNRPATTNTRPATTRPAATRPATQPATPPVAANPTPPRPQPVEPAAPPVRDPALDAYPDQ
jgi:hypothetical protein